MLTQGNCWRAGSAILFYRRPFTTLAAPKPNAGIWSQKSLRQGWNTMQVLESLFSSEGQSRVRDEILPGVVVAAGMATNSPAVVASQGRSAKKSARAVRGHGAQPNARTRAALAGHKRGSSIFTCSQLLRYG